MIAIGPKKFAQWFNGKYVGSHRQITADDVKDMAVSKLIHRHGYYSTSIDGETVRAVLQYEQLRESRSEHQEQAEKALACRICGRPLPPVPEGKPGRPREYCAECEPQRTKDRQTRSRRRRRTLHP